MLNLCDFHLLLIHHPYMGTVVAVLVNMQCKINVLYRPVESHTLKLLHI